MFDLFVCLFVCLFFLFYHFVVTCSSVPDSRQLDVFHEIIQAVLVFRFIRVLILTLAVGCVTLVLDDLNF